MKSCSGKLGRRAIMPFVVAVLACGLLRMPVIAQQVPIPTTAAEVPGPAFGTAMTTAYVQMVGRMAYLWGWPLVNSVNRAAAFSKAPEPDLLGGVVPVAFGRNAMLTNYIRPDQTFVTCTNQDVVYGAGYMALDKEPIVFQVPDFGDRFWVYAHYDARTDEFSEIGKQYSNQAGLLFDGRPILEGREACRHHRGGALVDEPGICRSSSFHGWHARRSQGHPTVA